MALTVSQIELLRDYINDPDNGSPVFDDDKLNLYYEASGDSVLKTRIMIIDILLSDANKLADYTQNASQERRSQIAGNLREFRKILKAELAEELSQNKTTIRLTGIRPVPQRRKDTP